MAFHRMSVDHGRVAGPERFRYTGTLLERRHMGLVHRANGVAGLLGQCGPLQAAVAAGIAEHCDLRAGRRQNRRSRHAKHGCQDRSSCNAVLFEGHVADTQARTPPLTLDAGFVAALRIGIVKAPHGAQELP